MVYGAETQELLKLAAVELIERKPRKRNCSLSSVGGRCRQLLSLQDAPSKTVGGGACGRREAAASHMTAHLTLVAGVGRALQGSSALEALN